MQCFGSNYGFFPKLPHVLIKKITQFLEGELLIYLIYRAEIILCFLLVVKAIVWNKEIGNIFIIYLLFILLPSCSSFLALDSMLSNDHLCQFNKKTKFHLLFHLLCFRLRFFVPLWEIHGFVKDLYTKDRKKSLWACCMQQKVQVCFEISFVF